MVVNIQGDEPFVEQRQIEALTACFADGGCDIATLRTPIRSTAELLSPNNVKVVCGDNGQALYFTPPVVDQWMFRGKDVSGTMAFSGEFVGLEADAEGDSVLVVTARRADGTAAVVRFEEGRIVVTGSSLDAEYEENFRRKIAIGDGGINFVFQGFRYRVPVCGAVQSTNKGFRISGDRIELDLSCADR